MQRIIVVDSAQFQANLQKKLHKLKQYIIFGVEHFDYRKKDQQTYLTRLEVIQKYRISLVTPHTLTVKMKLNRIKIGKRRIYRLDTPPCIFLCVNCIPPDIASLTGIFDLLEHYFPQSTSSQSAAPSFVQPFSRSSRIHPPAIH